MSSKAQVQLLYLANEYERESQEFSFMIKSLRIWSKDKHKPERLIPEQSDNSDHLSIHRPSTNMGKCILK